MVNDNVQTLIDILKKDWEDDLNFSKEENKKQLENYKRELEKLIEKKERELLEELEKKKEEIISLLKKLEIKEKNIEILEKELRKNIRQIYYWLFGIASILLLIILVPFFYLRSCLVK